MEIWSQLAYGTNIIYVFSGFFSFVYSCVGNVARKIFQELKMKVGQGWVYISSNVAYNDLDFE